MIEVKKFSLPDIIPQNELDAWRKNIQETEATHCPPEVREFIQALAEKLPDFGQIGKFNTLISGYELQLANMDFMNGQKVNPWEVYELPVPRMVAVDHVKWMHRSFNRKGKQGLIDYCRVQVKGTHLQRTLDILNVHVFKQDRPEFREVMKEIQASKKLEGSIE